MDPLPRPTGEGQWMVPAPTGTFLFVSPLEQHRVHWSVSWQAPLPLAAQLNVKLKDPSTAQVGPLHCMPCSFECRMHCVLGF